MIPGATGSKLAKVSAKIQARKEIITDEILDIGDNLLFQEDYLLRKYRN
jgi:hypothetical protein